MSIKKQSKINRPILKTTLSNPFITATINHKGAELISLKNSQREFIWEGNPEFWGKHSPVLFPIVGTLKENSYSYDGKNYGLSRHGFARDMGFELQSRTEDSATFLLESTEATLQMYPFSFRLFITYTLQDQSLAIEYKVMNTGKKMPFSIGAHPAFALPGNFTDYSLVFGSDTKLHYHLLENDLISDSSVSLTLNENKLPLDYELFRNDALVFKEIVSKTITVLEKEKPLISVHFDGFPNLGIWTKMDAPFLCIEPWFGFSDTLKSSGDLFEKEGIQILEPNSEFESKFIIEIV